MISNTTRRSLLSGGATTALAVMALGTAAFRQSTEPVFEWRVYGGDKFAENMPDAVRQLPRALVLLGVAEEDRAAFVELVRQHPQGMLQGELKNGDRLDAMLSRGGVVHRNVLVDFRDVIPGVMGPPPAFTLEWVHNGTRLVLPRICHNWSIKRSSCYRIYFDYRNQPDVVYSRNQHSALISALLTLTDEDLTRLFAAECFHVTDADGSRKPTVGCHRDACPVSGAFPTRDLAVAVGLPERKPPASFWFTLKDGVGYLSFPDWVLEKLIASVYCVRVYGYQVSASGYEQLTALSRFDVVVREELMRTQSARRLDRTLQGRQHY